MWVRFTADFSWRQPAFTIDYKEGMVLNVIRACAKDALTKGAAVKIAAPKQEIVDGGR